MRFPTIYNQKRIGNKVWKIELFKSQLFHDIDAATYKRISGGAASLDTKVKDAIASDSAESVDGRMILRLMDLRDAIIRKRIMFCLMGDDTNYANDDVREDDKYIYMLVVPETAPNSILNSIKVKMHEYIVRGALLDWYDKVGVPSETRNLNASDIQGLEDDICNSLRIPSYTRRPPQPFNPR